METMVRTERRTEPMGAAPGMVSAGTARMRELTPAQRRAVLHAQQQVLRARAARKALDERHAALSRQWDEETGETAGRVSEDGRPSREPREVSLRGAIGHVLRDLRTRDHKTLREVSEKAGVSLGYLSEVERGQKDASSELLTSIAGALGVSAAQMLRLVADYLDTVGE